MDEEKGNTQERGRAGATARPRRAFLKTWLIATAAIALLAWGVNWAVHRWTHVYIDDARIDGEVVTIASRVSGWITELPVIEGDEVKEGQVIARIDDRDSRLHRQVLLARLKAIESQMAVMRAQSGQVDQETLGRYQSEANRLAAAEADVAVAAADLKQASDDYERAVNLHGQKWLSQQAMERSRTAFRQAQENHRRALAQVEAVRGTLSAARGSRRQVEVMAQQLQVLNHQAAEIRAEIQRQDVDIADRAIRSPGDGRIVMTFARRGEHVAAGQRIAMFHDPREIWVQANVKETAVRLLSIGMKAQVRVDAYPRRIFEGEVYRIGEAATSKFALLPDPNPSGNFTKITQRLPVRILLSENDARLRPGMMAEVHIAVGND
jgi:membrane fusion protein, multidrug efflux system